MIDKMANVHSGAKIAKDVKVEAFATIYEDVEIGSGSWIGPNTVIMNGARIGKNVTCSYDADNFTKINPSRSFRDYENLFGSGHVTR